jgi:hypothetical protein
MAVEHEHRDGPEGVDLEQPLLGREGIRDLRHRQAPLPDENAGHARER